MGKQIIQTFHKVLVFHFLYIASSPAPISYQINFGTQLFECSSHVSILVYVYIRYITWRTAHDRDRQIYVTARVHLCFACSRVVGARDTDCVYKADAPPLIVSCVIGFTFAPKVTRSPRVARTFTLAPGQLRVAIASYYTYMLWRYVVYLLMDTARCKGD